MNTRPTECPECRAPIYDDPLTKLFIPTEPEVISYECGCVIDFRTSPPVGIVVRTPCSKSRGARVEHIVRNYKNGQNIFRRSSVEDLIEEIWDLRERLKGETK